MSRRRTNKRNNGPVQIREFLHVLASVHRVRAWLGTKPDAQLVRDVLILEERKMRNTAYKALKAYLEQDDEAKS